MKGSEALVIGGGLIGLAVSWRLAQRGLEVVLVDPVPGGSASHAAAGMLAPVTEVHYEEEHILSLNLESARRYQAFCQELEQDSGRPTGYLPAGTLAVAFDGDDLSALTQAYDFQKQLGLPVERLTGRECRELEPSLTPGIRGGVRVEGDHQVDPRLLVEALLEALARAGARIERRPVEAILTDGSRCLGARLAEDAGGPGGELRADITVLAAGAWSSQLARRSALPEGVLPPIRPVKGQILRLRHRRPPRLLNGTVRGLVEGSAVYLVPRGNGGVVLGATMEEQGFDVSVTAGAVYQLLRDAYTLLPGMTELELVECLASSRPCAPDNAPVIGPTALPGLVAATGHHRNGVLLTPVTADLVAEMVTDSDGNGAPGHVPELAQPFLPSRFAGMVS